jgi:hypothetical protein
MESTDLFSHPYEPEAVPDTETSSDQVHVPAFSDLPQSDSPVATPPPARPAD